jgi:hypothetical protein
MKNVVTTLAVAVLTTISIAEIRAQAQTAAPAAPPAAASASTVAAPAVVEKRPAPRMRQRSSDRADARVCLEFPTNLQIIKCAEKYRYMHAPA